MLLQRWRSERFAIELFYLEKSPQEEQNDEFFQ